MAVDRSRLPAVGSDPAFAFPRIDRHRLSNGLALRTFEHHSIPLVTFVFQVLSGSASDATGGEGLAALTADMLDEGTGALSAIDVSESMARIGAEFDVDVGPDATVLTLTTLSRFAERGAALLADLITRPSLRLEDFERVRQLRLDRLQQLRDVPPAVAERAFLSLLYGDHPYGHLAIGNAHALGALTLADVSRFHQTSYQPSRATLVIGGDLTTERFRDIAEDAFGGWTSRSEGDAARSAVDIEAPGNGCARVAIVPRERAAQSLLRIGHLSARRDSPDYPALIVMNAVLGGQIVSRVNLKLREEKGYTYGARTGFDWRRGIGPFSLETSVETRVTADAVRDALAELSAIRGERPATQEEMALAKAALTRGYPRSFETVQQVARSVAQLVLYELPDTYFETFVARVNGVTADEVTRVAGQYLHPSQMTTLIVGDYPAISGPIEDLHLGVTTIVAADL